MTDVSVADTAREVAANFTSGFDDVPVNKPAPEKVEGGKASDDPGANGAAPAPAPAADAPAAPIDKPKRARISHEEWVETRTLLANAKAMIAKAAGFESQIARLAGSVNTVQKAIQEAATQKQADTPLGLTVKFDDDDFKEFAENYPELAGINRRTLEALFKKVTIGRGTADPAKTEQTLTDAPKPAPTALTREDVATVLREEKAKEVSDKFIAAYPNWRVLVGAPDVDDGPVKESGAPFHAWLKSQPAEYQQRVMSTTDPGVMHEALDLFSASQKEAPVAERPAGQNRRAVIEGAVTPRADSAGPLPQRPKTERESMNEGFATG